MLQWATQFIEYYESQLKSFGITLNLNDSYDFANKNNQSKDKCQDFSPLTSVSTRSLRTADKGKIINKRKKFKKKLKILKRKQNILKNILSYSIQPQLGQFIKINQQNDEIWIAPIEDQEKQELILDKIQIVNQIVQQKDLLTESQPNQQAKEIQQQLSIDLLQEESLEEIIIYEKQFDYLYNKLNQLIIEKSQSKQFLYTPIMIVGQPKCGKKHMINQVLEKLCQQSGEQLDGFSQVVVDKIFVNEGTAGYLKEEIDDFDLGLSQLDSGIKNKKEKKVLRVNCIVVDGGMVEYGELIESYLNCQNAISNNLYIVVYTISYQQLTNQKHEGPNNPLIITLPSIMLQNQKISISQSLEQMTTKAQFIHQLHLLLASQLKSVENYINCLLQLRSHRGCKIQCSDSVKNFTIKFLVKRYELNYPSALHPIVAIQYLANHLKSHFAKQALSEISLKSAQDSQLQLSLSSTIVAQFFNQVLCTPSLSLQQSPIQQTDLASLILGLQLVLLSCYIYLTSPQYLNSLYINAINLYPFFAMCTQSLNLQPYEQSVYWGFLQKLKEKNIIKFSVDRRNVKGKRRDNNHNCMLKTQRVYMRKGQSYTRKGKKLRMLRDYKNHNFTLLMSMDKIKNDLSEQPIFQKFFTSQ